MKIYLGLVLGLFVFVAESRASNYPPDYCDQVVRVRHDGPMMVANVGSGCFSAVVLGYKNSGVLAGMNPHKIDALVLGTCALADGSVATRKNHIVLGREWHGTGYLSRAFSPYEVLPQNCYYGDNRRLDVRVEVAFSDGNNHWDSKHNQNYILNSMMAGSESTSYKTNAAGNEVNLRAWDIIVNEMKK